MPVGKYIVGNWKMNGLLSQVELANQVAKGVSDLSAKNVFVGVCPPFTLVKTVKDAVSDSALWVGGQDCHNKASGAHTGDVSANMLKDLGANMVILGHSERRANHGETSELVAQKTAIALSEGLVAIVCIGETEGERLAGKAIEVVLDQLVKSLPQGCDAAKIIIAYEPVWAIGTGRVASPADILEMHNAIRAELVKIFGTSGEGVAIQYGGSVNAANAAEILAIENVNGALVGGASLKAPDFLAIISAAKEIAG